MSYRILFPNRALDEFGCLPGNDYETVRDVIVNLGLEPCHLSPSFTSVGIKT